MLTKYSKKGFNVKTVIHSSAISLLDISDAEYASDPTMKVLGNSYFERNMRECCEPGYQRKSLSKVHPPLLPLI